MGCGNGVLTREVCKDIPQLTAIDSSSRAIDEARLTLAARVLNGTARIVEGSPENLYRSLGMFDAVLSCMVLEHIPDPAEDCASILRFLRIEGTLVVVVPCGLHRWTLEDSLVGHLRRYDRESLEKLLSRVGVEKIEFMTIGFPIINLTEWLRNIVLAIRLKGHQESESARLAMSKFEQTQDSGLWNSRGVNSFPKWFSFIVNRATMTPFHYLSRMFSSSPKATVLLAVGTYRGNH